MMGERSVSRIDEPSGKPCLGSCGHAPRCPEESADNEPAHPSARGGGSEAPPCGPRPSIHLRTSGR
jgi:hypothetical protein